MKVCTLHIQETISKKLYTIYKTSKPYLKVLYTHTKEKQKFIMVFGHFYEKKDKLN